MEKRIEVKTYMFRLYCDKCGTEMERDTIVLTSNPPTYQYECPKCGHIEKSNKCYPFLDREEETK